MNRRYDTLDAQADLGMGTDEFGGPRRFTRPCERITPTITEADPDTLDPHVRLRMLDRAADLLHEVVLETPRDGQVRDRLRDLAFAAKDAADMFARTHNLRTDLSGQEDAAVTADLGGSGDDGDSNPHKED
ncbi:hypothetical protein [Gordonia sp. i37]|uniref:hypothetical protein n=1 Tax=Gordonia sp. i37 TaxID=1961707 RepID=UPI0009AC83AF|nr:hypothetical protein [Gordonia sp. i37]OPX17028.1 hypothetical protein B1964_01740 [Gordonia sp. i37]